MWLLEMVHFAGNIHIADVTPSNSCIKFHILSINQSIGCQCNAVMNFYYRFVTLWIVFHRLWVRSVGFSRSTTTMTSRSKCVELHGLTTRLPLWKLLRLMERPTVTLLAVCWFVTRFIDSFGCHEDVKRCILSCLRHVCRCGTRLNIIHSGIKE